MPRKGQPPTGECHRTYFFTFCEKMLRYSVVKAKAASVGERFVRNIVPSCSLP